MSRVFARTLAALLLLSCLAGCVTIPTTGPVEEGAARGKPPEVAVEIAPDPPRPGASPRTIVDGFLQAMANYQQGYTEARKYLAPEVRDTWRPEEGVAVYADGFGLTTTPESAVLEAPLVGRVGPDGSFQHSTETLHVDFGMVKDPSGEWRISTPPRGLLVSQYLFAKFYQRMSTYFFDPSFTTLVPDPIFLPRGNQSASTLLQALLRGPTDWIRPVVVSAIPPQTKLNVRSAFLDEHGIVDVSLNDTIAGLGEDQRSLLVGQIAWTLAQIDGVSGIRLTVNGAPYSVPNQNPDGTVPVSALRWLDPISNQLSHQLFGATADGVRKVDDGARGAELDPAPGAWATMRDVTAVAPDLKAENLATVVKGTELWVGPLGDSPARKVLESPGMLRPQFARAGAGELWTVSDDDASGQAVRLVSGDKVTKVSAPAFAGARITAFRLAPEGVRIAAILQRNGRSELGLARINRSGQDVVIEEWRPIRVGEPERTAPSRLVDVGWADTTTLVLLAAEDNKRPAKPYRLDVNGSQVDEIGQPDNWDAEALATSPTASQLRTVLLGRNGAWRYEDEYRWPMLVQGLKAAGFPG